MTSALSRYDIDTATAHKRHLEDQQRAYEAARKARGEAYTGKLFRRVARGAAGSGGGEQGEGTERWVYRKLPLYAAAAADADSAL